MDEGPDNTNRRVEQMLRRWGAEQAAREHQRPQPAASAATRSFRALARWTAVAATLLIAAAVVVLVVGNLMRGGGWGRPVATAPAAQRQIDRLKSDLAKARQDLEDLQAENARDGETIASLLDRLSEQELRHATDLSAALADLAKVRKQSAAEKARLTDQAKRLTAELDGRRADLSAASTELAKTKAALVAAQADAEKSAGQLADLRKRLAAANAEITRASKSHQAALAAARDADNELTALNARLSATLAGFQRMYLTVAAPEKRGWAARQQAARERQLLARCARLRAAAREESARRLLDRLEVLLTRLELLDPAHRGAVEALAALAASSDVGGAIDAALAGGEQTLELRQWLMEARLVLAGAERVG